MSFQDRFYDAVLEYLIDNGHDALEIYSVEQDEGYGCETCGPELSIDVYYKNTKGLMRSHSYYGSLNDFLALLP